jgi:uncharacterized ferritin-like protein (DUF455 family)
MVHGALLTLPCRLKHTRAVWSDRAAALAVGCLRAEARGLDQMPTTVARFRSGGDAVTADLLEVILEVRPCWLL